MDKPLLEFYNFAAHVKITGHFEPAGPWEGNKDIGTVKVVTYEVIDHFIGNPAGWFYEEYSGTSCETGYAAGEEWAVFTLADKKGAGHASYCTGAQLLRTRSGTISYQALAKKGLYKAYVNECGGAVKE